MMTEIPAIELTKTQKRLEKVLHHNQNNEMKRAMDGPQLKYVKSAPKLERPGHKVAKLNDPHWFPTLRDKDYVKPPKRDEIADFCKMLVKTGNYTEETILPIKAKMRAEAREEARLRLMKKAKATKARKVAKKSKQRNRV